MMVVAIKGLIFSILTLLLINTIALICFYCSQQSLSHEIDVEANQFKKSILMCKYSMRTDFIIKLEKGPIATMILGIVVAIILALGC